MEKKWKYRNSEQRQQYFLSRVYRWIESLKKWISQKIELEILKNIEFDENAKFITNKPLLRQCCATSNTTETFLLEGKVLDVDCSVSSIPVLSLNPSPEKENINIKCLKFNENLGKYS